MTIYTSRNGKWAFQIISSCGLRNPEQVYTASDETILLLLESGACVSEVLNLTAGGLRPAHNAQIGD